MTRPMNRVCPTVGIITFHAAHNYGSMLQVYALQQVIEYLGFDCEVINLRTEIQRRGYTVEAAATAKRWKAYIDRSLIGFYKSKLQSKYDKFEHFLKHNLKLSIREFSDLEELEKYLPVYDYYIAGSDQIWNTSCFDFSWAYYLPFKTVGKKIAYAPSMGPNAEVADEHRNRIATYLQDFDAISVRESATANIVNEIINQKIAITLDPTLLVPSANWYSYHTAEPIIKEDYIFLYTPFPRKNLYAIAKYLSKVLKMKVVVSLYNSQMLLQYPSFRQELAVGPWEFLNLVRNARLTCCGSFHAVVFSILFHVPFFAIDGTKDQRMKNLLKLVNMEDRSIVLDNMKEKVTHTFDIDFSEADKILEQERENSIQFLQQSLTDKR